MTWTRNRRTIISLRLPVSVWYNCHSLSLSPAGKQSTSLLRWVYQGCTLDIMESALSQKTIENMCNPFQSDPRSASFLSRLLQKKPKKKEYMRQQRKLAYAIWAGRERGDYSMMVNVTVWPHRGPLPHHTSYLSFFLHRQNFWRIKFTPKNA